MTETINFHKMIKLDLNVIPQSFLFENTDVDKTSLSQLCSSTIEF